jgi:hypothetical protein
MSGEEPPASGYRASVSPAPAYVYYYYYYYYSILYIYEGYPEIKDTKLV